MNKERKRLILLRNDKNELFNSFLKCSAKARAEQFVMAARLRNVAVKYVCATCSAFIGKLNQKPPLTVSDKEGTTYCDRICEELAEFRRNALYNASPIAIVLPEFLFRH